jgi:hypothetical protein
MCALAIDRFDSRLLPVGRQAAATSRVSAVLSYLILLGGLLMVPVTVHMAVVSYSSLPWWDAWSQVGDLANGDHLLSPETLWRQHNEHRMVIPKLFFAADLYRFHGRDVFPLVSIFLVQFLHLGLLGWALRVLGGWRGALWRSGFGLLAFFLFSPLPWPNLVTGFQMCFVLPRMLATLSFVGLLLYWTASQEHPSPPPWRFLLLSIAAALGATYSLANGNLLWPLLVAAAVLLGLPRSAILSFVVSGIFSVSLYFRHYVQPAGHAHPLSSLMTPLPLLKYLALYFGSSWALTGHWPAIIGMTGLILAMRPVFFLRFYVRNRRPFAVLAVLILVFCVATALVTASARLNFGVLQALSGRYQTYALLFWCCLGLLLLESAYLFQPRRYRFLAVQICLLISMLRGAFLDRDAIEAARRHGFEQKVAAASLLTGVWDPEALQETFPKMEALLFAARYMRAQHLSVFSVPVASWVGRPLDGSLSPASAEDCAGVLEMAVPVDGSDPKSLRITGWAWDRKHHRPPSVVLVTTDGIINGVAAVGQQRNDLASSDFGLPNGRLGYIGYVREAAPATPVNLYAVLPGSPMSACYFASWVPSSHPD